MKHLWEVDHPYYGPENMYYANGYQNQEWHDEYESWADFVAGDGWYDADLDMNFLFRWDWKRPRDDSWYEEGEDDSETLYLFIVCPRKGANASIEITVTADDEDAVREWLAVRWEYMRTMWAPFSEEVS